MRTQPGDDTWRAHRAHLRRFVSRRVSDRHEAEDIVQDVLLRAHESMHPLNEDDRRLALLHENVKRYGTVFNTVSPGTGLAGELRRMSAEEAAAKR